MRRKAQSLKVGAGLLLLSAAGCSEDRWLGKERYLSAQQTAGSVSPDSSEYSAREFYVLRVDQLCQLRRPQSLSYLGSDRRFHYLRVWNKMFREGEVQYVALRRPDCRIGDEASIDDEIAHRPPHFRYHPWRSVTVTDGVCSVLPWSEEPSARPWDERQHLPPKPRQDCGT